MGMHHIFRSQLHPDNLETEVKVNEETVVTLKELLQYDWRG